MTDGKKVILFANTDWYLYNFRLGLARGLRERGYEVVLASPRGAYGGRLEAEFPWYAVDLGGGSKSAAKNLQAAREVHRLYKSVQPDVVHHFTIKCVLFGGWAARRLQIPAVHAITGLGHVFTDHRPSNRLARPLLKAAYRYVLGGNCQVIFQNEENREFFRQARLVDDRRSHLIRGSGADCQRFQPDDQPRAPGLCRFLFASRLLREKGIVELLQAFRQLRARGVDAELLIAGETYPDNPSSLTADELEDLKSDTTYLGHVEDTRPLFRQADVVVLPSYAEGTPRVLLEAGACGKPLIATDIAGCRGVVESGRNGFLVPTRQAQPLAAAMERLATDLALRAEFGRASREIIVGGFSEVDVIRRTIEVYERLGMSG